MTAIEDYIRQELKRGLKERLAQEPWVCIFCGAAGNGAETWTTWEPGTFWFPPDDHTCSTPS